MYRSPAIYTSKETEGIRKLLSKELASAFREAFAIERGNDTLDPDMADIVLGDTPFDPKKNPGGLFDTLVEDRVLQMIKELEDDSNEYTFSEEGEYILYAVLKYLNEVNSDMAYDECVLNGTDAKDMEDWDLIPMYVSSPFSDKEKADIEKYVADDTEQMDAEGYFDADNGEKKENRKRHLTLALEYPHLLINYFDLIFWDDDFTLIDELGLERFKQFRQSPMGVGMGLMDVNDMQPVSGSIKFRINEDGSSSLV